MTVQLLRIVDGPYASANVLLDLSPGVSGYQISDNYTFPPPQATLRKADTPLDDGDLVLDTVYGNRLVNMQLVLPIQASADARNTATSALAEVIQRPSFWLEVKSDGASASRYLRCYRPTDTDLLVRLGGGRWWGDVNLQLEADPFALAAKVTTDVTFDPDTWGWQTVSAVAGDVPTPAVVERRGGASSAGAAQGYMWLGARRRELVPATIPSVALVGTGLALGADATTVTGDGTAYSGNRVDISYSGRVGLGVAGTDLRTSATDVIPAQTDQRNRGGWRVFVRLAASAAPHGIQMRAFVQPYPNSGAGLVGPIVSAALSTGFGWYDTGLVVRVPKENAPVQVGYGDGTNRQLGAVKVFLDTGRVSGSGSTRIDAFMALPADDRLAQLYGHPGSGTVADSTFYDQINGCAWSESSSGGEVTYTTSDPTNWVGGLPMLSPTAPTDLLAIYNSLGVGGTDPVMRLHYWPRYLAVA